MTGKLLRPLVVIDETKCNGCGLCVTACAEGALAIVDGKAKLISENYCDGLGACLGDCPQGAITVEERHADAFDEEAVAVHLGSTHANAPAELGMTKPHANPLPMQITQTHSAPIHPAHSGCPGSMARVLRTAQTAPITQAEPSNTESLESALANWPVQLTLLPVNAPYFNGAHLLISADCVPFALPNFHQRFLQGRVLAIGCPKLDDVQSYLDKLTTIFTRNSIASVQVLHMEVPCCMGLVRIVQAALADSGKVIPLTLTRIGIHGDIQDTREIA